MMHARLDIRVLTVVPISTRMMMPMPAWDLLPRDILRRITDYTCENPIKFAGVCTGWRWLLDDPDSRRTIAFAYKPQFTMSVYDATRSFALFVCRRPPITTDLHVHIGSAKFGAGSALGAALVHLCPSLKTLRLEPRLLASTFCTSPFVDMCFGLESVCAHINGSLDMAHMTRLRDVNLTFDGSRIGNVVLPNSLQSARFQVLQSATAHLLNCLLGCVSAMADLGVLTIYTEVEYNVDAARFPCGLHRLVLFGTRRTHIFWDGAWLPDLVVLGLEKCQFETTGLSALLAQSRNIRALQLEDYAVPNVLDDPMPCMDVRHLPLVVLNVMSNRYQPRISFLLPKGIVKVVMGSDDMLDMLHQPTLQESVEVLVVALHHVDAAMFDLAWPRSIAMPRVRHVTAIGCSCVGVGALLGQRCPCSHLLMTHALTSDIETDMDIFVC